jgi:hypothetical protein
MKNVFNLLLFTIVALTLTSCSPLTKVYSEEEPGVNLYRYHTYNWADAESAHPGDNGPAWLSNNTRRTIRTAVEDRMNAAGFKVCTDNPDWVLHYHVVIKNEVLYVPEWTCVGPGNGPYDQIRCNRVRPVQYREGTLIIDLIDAKNGVQVWRGAAAGSLEGVQPADAEARIWQAVKAIFGKFPGPSGPPRA